MWPRRQASRRRRIIRPCSWRCATGRFPSPIWRSGASSCLRLRLRPRPWQGVGGLGPEICQKRRFWRGLGGLGPEICHNRRFWRGLGGLIIDAFGEVWLGPEICQKRRFWRGLGWGPKFAIIDAFGEVWQEHGVLEPAERSRLEPGPGLRAAQVCAAVELQNKLVLLGGSDGSTRLTHVQRFDPSTGREPRDALAAAVVGGRIFALGGCDDNSALQRRNLRPGERRRLDPRPKPEPRQGVPRGGAGRGASLRPRRQRERQHRALHGKAAAPGPRAPR